jgi:hypothetical protein
MHNLKNRLRRMERELDDLAKRFEIEKDRARAYEDNLVSACRTAAEALKTGDVEGALSTIGAILRVAGPASVRH